MEKDVGALDAKLDQVLDAMKKGNSRETAESEDYIHKVVSQLVPKKIVHCSMLDILTVFSFDNSVLFSHCQNLSISMINNYYLCTIW